MKATKFSQFLQDREELKFVDKPHWIYIFEALIWSLLIILAGMFAHSFIAENFIYPRLDNNVRADGIFINIMAYAAKIIYWGSIAVAITLFINKLIFWASTYVFASDRRLYMKTGLISVVVNEVSFEEIRKTDINYGLLGRFIGYGKLIMDARFVEDSDNLPFICYPEKFAKIIHHENDLASDINLSYVTNNMTDKVEKIVPKKDNVKDQVATSAEQATFVDHAFSQQEKKELDIETEAEADTDTDNEIADEFEEVKGVPNKTLNKPASQSLNFIKK